MTNLISPQAWRPQGVAALEPDADRVVRSGSSTPVVAGPGAGKTELLAQRAAYLLQTGNCPAPRRILAICFKRDAARNLRDRVVQRCGMALARRFDSYTFEAFAKSLVDRFGEVLPPLYRPRPDYEMLSGMYEDEGRAFLRGVPVPAPLGGSAALEAIGWWTWRRSARSATDEGSSERVVCVGDRAITGATQLTDQVEDRTDASPSHDDNDPPNPGRDDREPGVRLLASPTSSKHTPAQRDAPRCLAPRARRARVPDVRQSRDVVAEHEQSDYGRRASVGIALARWRRGLDSGAGERGRHGLPTRRCSLVAVESSKRSLPPVGAPVERPSLHASPKPVREATWRPPMQPRKRRSQPSTIATRRRTAASTAALRSATDGFRSRQESPPRPACARPSARDRSSRSACSPGHRSTRSTRFGG